MPAINFLQAYIRCRARTGSGSTITVVGHAPVYGGAGAGCGSADGRGPGDDTPGPQGSISLCPSFFLHRVVMIVMSTSGHPLVGRMPHLPPPLLHIAASFTQHWLHSPPRIVTWPVRLSAHHRIPTAHHAVPRVALPQPSPCAPPRPPLRFLLAAPARVPTAGRAGNCGARRQEDSDDIEAATLRLPDGEPTHSIPSTLTGYSLHRPPSCPHASMGTRGCSFAIYARASHACSVDGCFDSCFTARLLAHVPS